MPHPGQLDTFKELPVEPSAEIEHLRNLVRFLATTRDQLKRELRDRQEQLEQARTDRNDWLYKYRKLVNKMGKKGLVPTHIFGKPITASDRKPPKGPKGKTTDGKKSRKPEAAC
jgi:hypothetical protein